jgi:hypothetical protein
VKYLLLNVADAKRAVFGFSIFASRFATYISWASVSYFRLTRHKRKLEFFNPLATPSFSRVNLVCKSL